MPLKRKKGIYKYTCTCSDKAIYIGQTHRSCETRWKEHERAVEKQQWHHSGNTQHLQHCHEPFSKENFEVILTMQDKKTRPRGQRCVLDFVRFDMVH